jgi:glucosamine--fructose-6-phosphate aminotransferase (isomerizing)
VVKEKGKLRALREKVSGIDFPGSIGVGHTRWATHGEPSQINAHPHTDSRNQIALVHNGIIENYVSLKAELVRKRFRFRSATDTEIAANLIGSYYQKGRFVESFSKAVKRLQGFFAFVVMAKDEPDKLLAFKRSNPLVIGLGKGENFVASDVSALLPYTRKVLYLEDNEYAVLTRSKVEIFSLETEKRIKREPATIRWNLSEAQKGGYPHFMLKEIYEQPRVIEDILRRRIDHNRIKFDTLSPKAIKRLKNTSRVFTVSCGTAYHAGLVADYMLEDWAKVPAEAHISSEFRYSAPLIEKNDTAIFITQSGETADTLAALRLAKERGAFTIAIVNVVGSTIDRESDAVIYTHAGPEIGVASTKAYTAQLTTLALFAFYLGRLKKTIPAHKLSEGIGEFLKLPGACSKVLQQEKIVRQCAKKHYRSRNFLYLGRAYNYPTALEGALKLQEISYAHAHGYAAGEMKHGPIALIDRDQPVICIAPQSRTYEKMISNIEEIRAREGIVITIGTEGDEHLPRLSSNVFSIPKTLEVLSPILTVIPLQFFAYHIAVLNGRDVDQPRNLAKSVTVE